MLKTFLILPLLAFSLISCAPAPENVEFNEPKKNFGTQQSDADLALEASLKNMKQPSLSWIGEVGSNRVFQAAETLLDLGQIMENPKITKKGHHLLDEFYTGSNTTTKTTFADSLYVAAAVGETKGQSTKVIDDTIELLSQQRDLIYSVLAETEATYSWPPAGSDLEVVLDEAIKYLGYLLIRFKAVHLDTNVYKSVIRAFETQYIPLLRNSRDELKSILAEQHLTTLLKRLDTFLQNSSFPISEDARKSINKGLELSALIDVMKSPQDALTIIIEFWQYATPKVREEKIKAFSPELYDYLNGRSQSDLNCLKKDKCNDFILSLSRSFGILPKIEEFGILNIQKQMSEVAHEHVVNDVNAQSAAVLAEIPGAIRKGVHEGILQKQNVLQDIRTNYGAFLKRIASGFSKSELKNSEKFLNAIEVAKVRVELRGQGRTEISGATTLSGAQTGAEVLGTSMAAVAKRWKTWNQSEKVSPSHPKFMESVIAQVSKLLAIGGFRTESGGLSKAYARTINTNAPKGTVLDIRKFLSSSYSFAVPDVLNLRGAYNVDTTDKLTATARGQAELLRGISGYIRFFRDWEANEFDQKMGTYKVATWITEVPADSVTQKFFPKDLLFSVGVGNAAVILQNMTKTLSSICLVDAQDKFLWANEADLTKKTDVLMAAVVDIQNGVRADIIRSSDISRLIIAISEFIQATKGIEKTLAPALLDMDNGTERSVDVLIRSREQLKQLVFALGNFISRKMQGPDGGIHGRFSRSKNAIVQSDPRRLQDQILAIRAFLAAAESSNVEFFRASALDTFFYMNKNLWTSKFHFYSGVEGSQPILAEFTDLLMTLQAGLEIYPWLPEASRRQWLLISKPWLAAIEAL